MRILDNLLAIRILWLLVTPFEKTDAYKLGLISADGEIIKKAKSSEETNATSMLHRLVWRIKRFINMVPGGSSRIGSIIAAYALVRENVLRLEYSPDIDTLNEQYTYRQEEEWVNEELIQSIIDLMEDAPANAAGAAVSTDAPVVPKKIKKFKASNKAFSSIKNGANVSRRLGSYLDLDEESDQKIFEYIQECKKGMILLQDQKKKNKVVQFNAKVEENRKPKAVLEGYLPEWTLLALDLD